MYIHIVDQVIYIQTLSHSHKRPSVSTSYTCKQVVEVPRFIALTPERMLVLETVGGLTAAAGRVKSNHHLTELVGSRRRTPFSRDLQID